MLRTPQDDEMYFAAGIPWFTTLFGRDSLLTALFVLPYHARIAEETLRLLAKHQGQVVDEWRDEEPGKILHELRVGELANLGQIPHTPYYGTVDATPLFLLLLARHAHWTGRLDLFEELRVNVESALAWMDVYGERTHIEGYICYYSDPGDLLVNQGWKDSGDGIIDEDGHVVRPPIALVEVQGYTFAAKMGVAELYERIGDMATAIRLRSEANALRQRFNQDFWIAERDFYALGLVSGGKPLRVISSNPGHALFSGIADAEKAAKTAQRLMTEGMFTGWGVRTLASNEKAYNPIAYHRGTVWPHDNAIIVGGLHRYGFNAEAARIVGAMTDAAAHFPLSRLPEVFSGFSRDWYDTPIRYPVACHPQAWAAGSIPFMLASLLGVHVNGFERILRIRKPTLPPDVDRLEFVGLAVGSGRVDIAFARLPEGAPTMTVLRNEGDVDIIVDDC